MELSKVTGRSLSMMALRHCAAAIFVAMAASSAATSVRAETGMASFYGGGITASGEVTRAAGFTAAHRTLPFGTQVLVTNIGNGKTVVVRITDRGPYGRRRIIDVSRAAARQLDMIESGTTKVSVILMGPY